MKAQHRAGIAPHELKPGEWTAWNETIYARCPNGLLANLEAHTKSLDYDAAGVYLTVSPSILCTGGADGKRFHGFIERGIWLGENRQPVPTDSTVDGARSG